MTVSWVPEGREEGEHLVPDHRVGGANSVQAREDGEEGVGNERDVGFELTAYILG